MAGWNRVEAMARDLGLTESLEARVADPLWLLARQWQVGEFHGEDAAQPALVRVSGRSVPLVSFRAGLAPPVPLGTNVPLEALAEATTPPAFGGAALHAASRAGRRLGRLLRDAGLDAGARTLEDEFTLAPPAHMITAGTLGRAGAELLQRHGLDGAAVVNAPASRVTEVLASALGGDDLTRAEAILDDWRAWYATREVPARAGPPSGSWDEQRLGYRFSVAAPGPEGEVTLAAPDHDGGHLDWYSFDVPTGVAAKALAHGVPQTESKPPRTTTAVPTPVRYSGMPASRFWEFEDGEVHFGDLDAGPADLARLLVAEFATAYGDDWFVVPMQVDAGTLTELTAVEVLDTFGGRTAVPSTAQVDAPSGGLPPRPRGTEGGLPKGNPRRAWRLFELTGDEIGDGHPSPWLLVPPTISGGLDGPPLERVALARDEAANQAWGIEHLVEGALGRAVDRAEAWGTSNVQLEAPQLSRTATPAAPGESWRYRLESTAPPWWVPLIPERIDPDAPDGDLAAQVRLRRARMQAWTLLNSGQVGPMSALLDPGRPRWLAEEEVPAAGVRVERGWRLARWLDGSVHLWHGWRVTPGRGEAASGLRWDLLDRQS